MLSHGLQTARSGLSATSTQIDVVSRNVAHANDATATRKSAVLATGPTGAPNVDHVDRAAAPYLLEAALGGISDASAASVAKSGLAQLHDLVGDASDGRSPAAMLGKVRDALQLYTVSPADGAAARSVIGAAKAAAQSLNAVAARVDTMRSEATDELAKATDSARGLLAKFAALNQEIVRGSLRGNDVTDQMDARDATARDLADLLGVRTVERAHSDMALYLDSGATLFDGTPRAISIDKQRQPDGTLSSEFTVDGVAVAGEAAVMPLRSGRIKALIDFRDGALDTVSAQLDETARGLVAAFAETDTSGAGLPDRPGLFTFVGATAMPADGVRVVGLAAKLVVDARFDSAVGGNPHLLRDGGANGSAYIENRGAGAGFQDRLTGLQRALSATRAFDPSAGLATARDVLSFSADASGWLGDALQTATQVSDTKSAVRDRTTQALSQQAGISLDNEMLAMLQLEKSYQASTRLISVIDDLLRTTIQGGQ